MSRVRPLVAGPAPIECTQLAKTTRGVAWTKIWLSFSESLIQRSRGMAGEVALVPLIARRTSLSRSERCFRSERARPREITPSMS